MKRFLIHFLETVPKLSVPLRLQSIRGMAYAEHVGCTRLSDRILPSRL